MIVKDEAHTIGGTLRSVKPYIDRWAIVDTGSTDDTKGEIERALAGVPGEVSDAPFIDFATTRNVALDRAGERTEFVMWLDADDHLEHGPALREFLERERKNWAPDHEAYYLRVDTGIRFDSARVFRARAGWRFKGAVHEVLVHPDRPPPRHRVPDALVRHTSEGVSAERSMRRWERDVGLLSGSLERDPRDSRAAFYLAETLRWLGRHEEAIAAFDRRIALGGWMEEVFQAKLDKAGCAQSLGRPWPDVLALYLDAHQTSPHRAEPLHAIAQRYNAEGQHALCFLFARRGYEMPIPLQDRLFLDEDVYTWKLADLLGASAYWIGEHELGEAAVRKALRHRPDDPRLRANLEFYLARRRSSNKARGAGR
jgi:tetratricopeptide (TPR) repeat protein